MNVHYLEFQNRARRSILRARAPRGQLQLRGGHRRCGCPGEPRDPRSVDVAALETEDAAYAASFEKARAPGGGRGIVDVEVDGVAHNVRLVNVRLVADCCFGS